MASGPPESDQDFAIAPPSSKNIQGYARFPFSPTSREILMPILLLFGKLIRQSGRHRPDAVSD